MTGRPRSVYRKNKLSRIALRELGSKGLVPAREVELVRGRNMSTHDPISDLITRIRNAQMRAKPKVSTPGSKMRANVLEVLKTEGYIRGYASVEHASGRSELEIELKYFDGEPVIREIERYRSRGGAFMLGQEPAARQQRSRHFGVIDAEGIMADHEAREANVGGEILFTVF